MNEIKCDSCGKFISPDEFTVEGEGSCLVIPDTEVTSEEVIFRCGLCTIKYGRPTSLQYTK